MEPCLLPYSWRLKKRGVLCSGATWKQRDKECTRHCYRAAHLIPTLEETPMKSITRLATAVVAVIFAVATLCPAQDVKPTDLGKGAAFNGKKIEIKDKGEAAYLRAFTSGKEVEGATAGPHERHGHPFISHCTYRH